MSTLILSLLLLFLVAVGLLMGAKVAERFENPEQTATTITVSPALKNMMVASTPAQPVSEQTELTREQDLQNARNALGPGGQRRLIGPGGEERAIPMPPPPAQKPELTPAPPPSGCPVCPDMSQYIRLDEVPCWNCTLP